MAMKYANKGIIPPKEWEYNKFTKYGYWDGYDHEYCYTIAEILSSHGIIPS